jgi:hypothetical protein
MHAPTDSLWAAVKCILCYLRGTDSLWAAVKCSYDLYITRSASFALHGFTDANWACSIDDRKSTGGYPFFFD